MSKKYEITTYPNHPEFKLINLYPVEKIHYRRGNSYEYMFSEDYQLWQDYFCDEYIPEDRKKILLFHCCSWSKPYDFSYIINPIRNIAKKYECVHRVILSNVGVVPYEYQMNPTFCSYDYPPMYDSTGMDIEKLSELRKKRVAVSYERIYRYLKAHKSHYSKVITLSSPVQYGMYHIVSLACKELEIDYENVISKELYNKYKSKKYLDKLEIYIEPEILNKLDEVLEFNCR